MKISQEEIEAAYKVFERDCSAPPTFFSIAAALQAVGTVRHERKARKKAKREVEHTNAKPSITDDEIETALVMFQNGHPANSAKVNMRNALEAAYCVRKARKKAKQQANATVGNIDRKLSPFWENAVMRGCSQCGNKRCPRSMGEQFVCTNSNEPDQVPKMQTGKSVAQMEYEEREAALRKLGSAIAREFPGVSG